MKEIAPNTRLNPHTPSSKRGQSSLLTVDEPPTHSQRPITYHARHETHEIPKKKAAGAWQQKGAPRIRSAWQLPSRKPSITKVETWKNPFSHLRKSVKSADKKRSVPEPDDPPQMNADSNGSAHVIKFTSRQPLVTRNLRQLVPHQTGDLPLISSSRRRNLATT